MTEPRKIAIFGGTFDPIHHGHLHLASLAMQNLKLDEIRFLPCRISPHKTGSHPSSGEDRHEMLRLATAALPWAVIDDFELHQTGPSYSYQTAESMIARFPLDRLFWIMGGDQWEALPHWKHSEILARCVEFIVLARGKDPQPRHGFRLHIVRGQHPASASEIRQSIAKGQNSHPWLDSKVAGWIQEKALYRGQ